MEIKIALIPVSYEDPDWEKMFKRIRMFLLDFLGRNGIEAEIDIARPHVIEADTSYKGEPAVRETAFMAYLYQLNYEGHKVGITSMRMKGMGEEDVGYGWSGRHLFPDANMSGIWAYNILKMSRTKMLAAKAMAKTIVHELGHHFEMEHCKNTNCVMFISIEKPDDKKYEAFIRKRSILFCPSCRAKIIAKSEK